MMDPSVLFDNIDSKADQYIGLSDALWEHPEEAFQETYAARTLALFLEEEGFRIQRGRGNLKTAFVAEYGSGKPVIGLLGEYDALPGLSQCAGVSHRSEIAAGGPGHGCGHHLLGVGAAAAAVAVKHYLEQRGIPGTIRFYGCPAEEAGCGKGLMVKAGKFADVDACFTWHPGTQNYVVSQPYLSNIMMEFDFSGQAAHAAASPELGRSALDACELMNVGANYLREHVSPGTRFHYAYMNAGGLSPNTVPESAGLVYYVRAGKVAEAREVAARIRDIAKGAALMTGTRSSCRITGEIYDYIPNHTLGRLMNAAFHQVGAPAFTEEDIRNAAQFYQSKSGAAPLSKAIFPYEPSDVCMSVSSDVGNVSHLVPTAQIYACCYARGTQFHTWQMTAQGKKPAAYTGMLTAAKVMALSSVCLLEEPARLKEAKEEWAETVRRM